MKYTDGFVAAVPTANKAAYLAHAKRAARFFKAEGAISVIECWGDDVPQGEVTSFPMAVQCREDETVVFSWITWPSRAHRDAAMQKIMTDPEVEAELSDMPFDGKRLIYGGFEVMLEE